MKISFLIPTKDRLALLKHTIVSILDQPKGAVEIEIIVTDNASGEDYGSYIAELADARIIYFRQPEPVSVTENWQKALSLATGDYVLMLGDDDALAPDFMSRLSPYFSAQGPDVIYIAGYHYCYPGVMPGREAGYLASVLNSEFLPRTEAFDLDPAYAHGLAESVLDFHLRFGMNSQHFVLKSSFARSFSRIGGLFQSPYPDTFAAVAIWTHAKSITVVPKELVIIGISPRSFGAYYFSGRHDEGYRFLDNEQVDASIRESLKDVILPGDRNNTNWLVAVASARAALPGVLKNDVGKARYRALQIVGVLRDSYLHGNRKFLEEMRARLTAAELNLVNSLEAVLATQDVATLQKSFDAITARLRQYEPATVTTLDIGPHASIRDAFAWLKSHDGGALVVPQKGDLAPVAQTNISQQEQPMSAITKKATPPSASGRVPFRGLVRSAALAIPPLRRLYDRANKSAEKIAALEAENRVLRHQLVAAGVSISQQPLSVAVHRNGAVILVAPTKFDEFECRSGDAFTLEPPAEAEKLLRTPDGHYHIQIAPDVGLRIPPRINLIPFKGFMVPEHLLALTGAGFESFDAIGKAHIANHTKFMGLDRDMTFVEIGSGIGRDAFQLLDIIGPNGRYMGIDVQRESIVWCQQNITKRHPNFEFVHFNAYHELHNPLSTKTTMDFRIPLPDRSVDRVTAGSVLTHIFRDEVTHYMKEIARVLKPEGLAYLTFFLYTEEAVAASRRNNLTPYNLRFEHAYGPGCYINDPAYPTGAVAYTPEAMQAMIDESGLKLARPYLKGLWSGLYADGDDGQDVAVLRL